MVGGASAFIKTNLSSYRELSEKCTCDGDKRNAHQKVLKDLTETAERCQHEADARGSPFAGMNMKGYDPAPGLYMTVRRQYTGMFISRFGLFGVSFQRRPEFKKGDKIVVLDGIPAPVIPEETGDGATYKMKATADVVGITHVDIERLVELGVCKRRGFKII